MSNQYSGSRSPRRPGGKNGAHSGASRPPRRQAAHFTPPRGEALPLLRPRSILPPFWAPLHRFAPEAKRVPLRVSHNAGLRVDQTAQIYRLALSAAAIPHRIFTERDHVSIYVPALYSRLASREALASLAENRPYPKAAPNLPAYRNMLPVVLCLLTLLVWYGVCRGALPLFPSFTPEDWNSMGAADAFRMVQGGQWYRAITALTLHSDSAHVLGNVFFGAVFMAPLCRRTGLGPGLFLTVLAGVLGNGLNTLFQPAQHVSIGFSTSVFGAVGLLCGIYGVNAQRGRLWVVLGAGLALLALLGSEGARTDIMAHLFGLACGFALGLPTGLFLHQGKTPPAALFVLLGLFTALATGGAWFYAVRLRLLSL